MFCNSRPHLKGYLALVAFWVVGLATANMLAAAIPATAGDAQSQLRTDYRFKSPVLKRDIQAAVYLPALYFDAMARTQRFPVVYLLHGLGDDHTAWPRLGSIKPTLDRMIAAGQLRPLIVVMPDAQKSWYVNDVRGLAGYGAVFDAFRSDLLDAVDRRFRTVSCRIGRAIGGLSMGGYGSLILGMATPHRFASVFSLSGAVFTEQLSDNRDRAKWLASLYHGVHGAPVQQQRLREWNTFRRLQAHEQSQQSPRVWLSTGDDDGFPSIVTGTVRAFDILRRKGITSELRVDDAGHDWSYWQRSVQPALEWAAQALEGKCASR